MDNPIFELFFILLFLIVIIGLPILLLVLSHYRNQNKQTTRQYTEIQRQYSSVQHDYSALQTDIQQKEEEKKEVAKRRRVTIADKKPLLNEIIILVRYVVFLMSLWKACVKD